MPECPACKSTRVSPFNQEIVHKPNCPNKPKLAGGKCDECGAPKEISGIKHLESCSQSVKLVEDYLLRSIGIVCKDDLQGVLPMRCYGPARPPVPSGEALLKQPPGQGFDTVPAVGDVMIERLLTALSSIKNANKVDARLVTEPMSIRAFRAAGEGAQLVFIDQLWNRICTSHPFDRRGNQMSDPAGDDLGDRTLPSSVCPMSPGASTFHKRLRGRQPFREFGIGFRVDGSDQGAISRILGAGMTQQRLSSAFMLGPRRGMRLDGTNMMDTTRARCWTGNNDIFNETAVCVSRNFFGGTAFPERETQGTCYLWAVNCGPLLGFDTEQYQLDLRSNRQWRPGEKAFPFIPPSNVLAYVQIDRRGAPRTGGWRVDIPRGARWTFTGATMTVKQRGYIENELEAWRGGSYTIPATYDFAT
jgi:hypothetical protein